MYDLFHDISLRPMPFSRYTAKELWTRPHLSKQMLNFHLSQETDLASRKVEFIDDSVEWIDGHLSLSGKRLCDLGCGPGLYTRRFFDKGAEVTGVDFSDSSLDYAGMTSNSDINYLKADYISDELPSEFDVITLIYIDFCALSPNQRSSLLSKIRRMLKPNGHLVLDVAGSGSFLAKEEATFIEDRLMGGFWAEGEYVGIQKSFIYEDQRLVLDRYIIIEPKNTWQIFNWIQHFTPQMIKTELQAAGFAVVNMSGDLTGASLSEDSDFIAIIAN